MQKGGWTISSVEVIDDKISVKPNTLILNELDVPEILGLQYWAGLYLKQNKDAPLRIEEIHYLEPMNIKKPPPVVQSIGQKILEIFGFICQALILALVVFTVCRYRHKIRQGYQYVKNLCIQKCKCCKRIVGDEEGPSENGCDKTPANMVIIEAIVSELLERIQNKVSNNSQLETRGNTEEVSVLTPELYPHRSLQSLRQSLEQGGGQNTSE